MCRLTYCGLRAASHLAAVQHRQSCVDCLQRDLRCLVAAYSRILPCLAAVRGILPLVAHTTAGARHRRFKLHSFRRFRFDLQRRYFNCQRSGKGFCFYKSYLFITRLTIIAGFFFGSRNFLFNNRGFLFNQDFIFLFVRIRFVDDFFFNQILILVLFIKLFFSDQL